MKFRGKRAILFALLGIFIVFSGDSCQKSPQNGAKTSASKSSEILEEVGDDYMKFMLEESLYLRMKHG